MTIVLVAIGYALLALVAHLMTVLDDMVPPIWLPAGFALAAASMWGARMWPGIWLGAFVAAYWLTGMETDAVTAALVGTGATIHALIGLFLVRSLMEVPMPLTQERDIARFLLFGGPVASLAAILFLAAGFHFLGPTGAPDPADLKSWWLAQTLGVVLVAPLALFAWRRTPPLWGGSRVRVALPLLVTAGFLAAGHQASERIERDHAQGMAHTQIDDTYQRALFMLETPVSRLRGVERFFAASEEVTAQEFATYTSYLLSVPGTLSIDWVPRVPASSVGQVHGTALAHLARPHRIVEPDANDMPRLAANRDEYFPVLYSAQQDALRAMPGLDHGFEAVRRLAITRARDSATPVAVYSDRVPRVGKGALLVFMPTFAGGLDQVPASEEQRRQSLLGFVVLVLDIKEFLSPLASEAAQRNLQLRITDVTPGQPNRVLVDTLSPETTAGWQRQRHFAGRLLRTEMRPTAVAKPPEMIAQAWSFDAFSFVGACLVAFASLGAAGRNAVTTAEVRERTAALHEARHAADRASQAKSAFLATMSHEIRTPMNGILGMVEVLSHSKLSAHQKELVGTVRESAGVLLGIIDDILDFSKIEAERLELEQAPVSIVDLVEGLCSSLVPIAARKAVELRLFVAPELPGYVLADDVRVRQVLYNLIGNAMKFSAGRPHVRGRVSVRAEVAIAEPLRVRFSIADNGIGMDAATVENLFTPFTQAEVSTTRRYGGTGLGLAICKRLVDLMDGAIEVASTPGEGSTFTVTLPLQPAPEQPAPEQPENELPDLSGLGCVVIDSPEFEADDLRRYLEHAGARVHIASDPDSTAPRSSEPDAPVVVIRAGERRRVGTLPENPDAVRQVVITRGRRRRARIIADDVVGLDGDALRRGALLRAVAVAAGRASPEVVHEDAQTPLPGEIRAPTVGEAREAGRLILVVEDDAINQKVVLQQLALLGHAAELAGDGAEALKMWRSGNHALILTDLHMPKMDGYALSEAIRREERARGGPHVPILALTANALRGEAHRTLAAGIDEHLTKPIQLAHLRETLDRWLPTRRSEAEEPVSPPMARDDARPPVDPDVLRSLVGEDEAVVRELLGDYLAALDTQGEALRQGIAARDLPEVGRVAHKLKSSSRAIGAAGLGDLCAELEDACARGDGKAVADMLERFVETVAAVRASVRAIVAGSDSP